MDMSYFFFPQNYPAYPPVRDPILKNMSRRKNTHHDEFLADAKRRRLIDGSDDFNETIGIHSASTHQSDHASEVSHMQGAVNLGQVVLGLPFDQEGTSVNSGLALEVLSPSFYLDPCDFERQSEDNAPTGYEIAPATGGDSQSVTSISRQVDMSEIVCFGMVFYRLYQISVQALIADYSLGVRPVSYVREQVPGGASIILPRAS